MMSLAARGSFGKLLTYSETKRRPYVRSHTIPRNPRSRAQISIRAMLTFLSQQWSELTEANKATFDAAAAAAAVAPYHVYCGQNQARNRRFLAPQQTYQPTVTGESPSFDEWDVQGFTDWTRLQMSDDEEPELAWAYLIYMSHINPFTPTWDQLVGVVEAHGFTTTWVEFHDLPPNAYVYRFRTCTPIGKLGTFSPEAEVEIG